MSSEVCSELTCHCRWAPLMDHRPGTLCCLDICALKVEIMFTVNHLTVIKPGKSFKATVITSNHWTINRWNPVITVYLTTQSTCSLPPVNADPGSGALSGVGLQAGAALTTTVTNLVGTGLYEGSRGNQRVAGGKYTGGDTSSKYIYRNVYSDYSSSNLILTCKRC